VFYQPGEGYVVFLGPECDLEGDVGWDFVIGEIRGSTPQFGFQPVTIIMVFVGWVFPLFDENPVFRLGP
jgi:hypothetical protein